MNAPESDSEIRSPTSLDTIQIGKNGETIKLPTKKVSFNRMFALKIYFLKQTAGKEKIGHRRVNKVTGEVTYKKTASSSISGAIQLGIAHSVGQLSKVK